uniref:Bm9793 n=1 Tax=Brugia malayi TaxID=6279 RepID=A0A0J9XU55_BRUMA|nr:Bm9793 [Brugia malayi]
MNVGDMGEDIVSCDERLFLKLESLINENRRQCKPFSILKWIVLFRTFEQKLPIILSNSKLWIYTLFVMRHWHWLWRFAGCDRDCERNDNRGLQQQQLHNNGGRRYYSDNRNRMLRYRDYDDDRRSRGYEPPHDDFSRNRRQTCFIFLYFETFKNVKTLANNWNL